MANKRGRAWRNLAIEKGTPVDSTPEAKAELREAYMATFRGKAGETVLSDLANVSGFFAVALPGEDLADHNGRRKVFGRILALLDMSEFELSQLISGARGEALQEQRFK